MFHLNAVIVPKPSENVVFQEVFVSDIGGPLVSLKMAAVFLSCPPAAAVISKM